VLNVSVGPPLAVYQMRRSGHDCNDCWVMSLLSCGGMVNSWKLVGSGCRIVARPALKHHGQHRLPLTVGLQREFE